MEFAFNYGFGCLNKEFEMGNFMKANVWLKDKWARRWGFVLLLHGRAANAKTAFVACINKIWKMMKTQTKFYTCNLTV